MPTCMEEIEGVAQAKQNYESLPPEQQLHFQKIGTLNIKWSGKEDWSTLTEKEKQQKIIRGIYFELVATSVLKRL